MARAVRMDYPDTFYHVLSRGNNRKKIFRETADYQKFMDTMRRMVDRYRLEIHGFVLMSNHYHMLIRTRTANLSRSMQWLGLSYSLWFNHQYRRSGHVFQGRFKSFVIENDHYFKNMCLYIHRNPVRARIVQNLRDYPWSSYPYYLNKRKRVRWLTRSLVLGMFDDDVKSFIDAHQAYSGEESNLLNKLKYGLFLGSDQFVEKWKEKLSLERHREKPQVLPALREQGIESVLERVFADLGVRDPDSLLRPLRNTKRPERDLAIYILSRLGLFTQKEIGQLFKVGYTSIPGTLKRAQTYLESDMTVKRNVERILNDI